MSSLKLRNIFKPASKWTRALIYSAVSVTSMGVAGVAMLDGTEKVVNEQPSGGQSAVLAVSLLLGFWAGARARRALTCEGNDPSPTPPSKGGTPSWHL